MHARLLLAAALAASAVAEGPGAQGCSCIVPLGPRVELHVCSDTILRVVRRPTEAALTKTSLVVRADWPEAACAVDKAEAYVTVSTDSVLARYDLSTGRIAFFDKASGKLRLQEAEYSFMGSKDLGRDAFQVEQRWDTSAEEGLYGGGGYQNGIVNLRHAPLEMIQFNTEAVVPFFWSTAGYGLLWDNYAWTFLNPPEKALVTPHGPTRGRTTLIPAVDGDHFFFVGRPFPAPGERPSFGQRDGGWVQVNLTDAKGQVTVVQNWESQMDMPRSLTGVAPGLKKGAVYTVDYSWKAGDVGLFVQGPEYGRTTLRSFLGDAIDYYFVLGGSPDAAVAGYRTMAGAAPMYARWVYGFWQCKEHYDSQDEVVAAAKAFRDRWIPVDAIVQDWLYWGDLGWGPQWDSKRYPDPQRMVKSLHDMGLRFMVSVWSKFDARTTFYKQMREAGWMLGDSPTYDAWNPSARELFYNFSKASHFSIGVDALWLDATEPEDLPNVDAKCYLGSGNAYMNTYSLMATQAISDGLRRDYPDAQGARVFSLTRSSFAGQQRTGAALWSGDTSASWDSLRRQVASSVAYQMSGMPYWSQDIGGFFRPEDQYTSADYRDRLTRWFQFGVFTPVFRVHGYKTSTEIWNFGDEALRNINASAISLRYRLLPYIYSGFARVASEGYTMQRGLPMAFPEDQAVRSIADEFMFGDAFLVAPIFTPTPKGANETSREVYLPQGAPWIHFHSGARLPPGRHVAAFGLGEAPAFVRAGSVVPLGPLVQSTSGAADPLEVRVYPGADANFTLFEDDGVSRTGPASRIRFSWLEHLGEFSVADREGSFDGMLEQRTINVVLVGPGHGVGVDVAPPSAVLRYSGSAMAVRLLREIVV